VNTPSTCFLGTEDDSIPSPWTAIELQAAGMDEAADPSVADIFRYKIPASFNFWARFDQVVDALAVARQLGKSSFWLTVTTINNPLWPGIQEKLRRGGRPERIIFEVPTVVNRAFHGCLDKLKTFLCQHFGGLLYEIGMVEFQKRGLSHAHVVVKLVDCHVYVDVCTTTLLFLYLFKGPES
jgi:Helitron helicase-like domain at N-terminus